MVLFQPEIPPNTGSIARLCAATLTPLHLIEPLGFKIDDKHLKRAGLDYWEFVDLRVYKSWYHFLQRSITRNLLYFSKRASRSFTRVAYQENDYLIFGPETRGLPEAVLDLIGPERVVRLPMRPGSRSLNLSNTVAVAVFEAWRQLGYAGGR